MALAATTVFEVRIGGSDLNGGGFNAARGGTDYTLQTAAQASGTVTSSGTTVTATTGIFTAAMVGNLITDGTTWKEITAYTSSTVVTVDSAPSWTAASINVGGAMASVGVAAAIRVTGNTVFVKYNATPYTISSTSANAAGGVVNDTAAGSDSVMDYWVGYDTTRTVQNTDANMPTLQVASAGVTSVSVFKVTASSTVVNALVRNLIIDGQSKSAVRGFDASTSNAGIIFDRCQAINCTNSGFCATSGRPFFARCYAAGCSSQPAFLGESHYFGCVAAGNSAPGFSWANATGTLLDRCVAANNSGGSSDGFQGTLVGGRAVNCVAYNNGRDGFNFASTVERGPVLVNCVAVANGQYGFNGASNPVVLFNCAGGVPNTSGNQHGIEQSFGFVTLTVDPFTNAAGGDFSLNTTAGGGAALRAAGLLGAFPGISTTGYLDIGGVQHQDSGGGGGGLLLHSGMTGGLRG